MSRGPSRRAGPARFTLPRRLRLLAARDFRRVYQRGRRAHGKSLVVVALPRRQGGLRLGVSVAKSHGSAVRRNKIKRLLREAFRLERPGLPDDLDLILIPLPRPRYSLAELRTELAELVRRPGRRAPRPPEPAR